MTLGEKLSKLRKENNYTQEQFADLLEVSRQSISKWESDISFPETEKLIRISKLYNCSLDYLLKDEIDTFDFQKKEYNSQNENIYVEKEQASAGSYINISIPAKFNKKSKREIHGLPLWHITNDWRVTAKGVLAIGFRAQGILSIGMLSMGLVSLGLFSFGLLSLGVFALGILAAGSFSAGIFSAGAISIGMIAVGAVAVGEFAFGAAANGHYLAMGDTARAAIALGQTKAYGDLISISGVGYGPEVRALTGREIIMVKEMLDSIVPSLLGWAKNIIEMFL